MLAHYTIASAILSSQPKKCVEFFRHQTQPSSSENTNVIQFINSFILTNKPCKLTHTHARIRKIRKIFVQFRLVCLSSCVAHQNVCIVEYLGNFSAVRFWLLHSSIVYIATIAPSLCFCLY